MKQVGYTTHRFAELVIAHSIDQPQRVRVAREVLDQLGARGEQSDRQASLGELATAHDRRYLKGLRDLSALDLGCRLDPELHVDRHSWPAAACAAAAVIDQAAAAESWNEDQLRWCISRPGSHHAGPDYALGFCLINNLAAGAARILDRYDRVAIIDFDAHHGNGTQQIFYRAEQVLAISIHQHPFFPGTGAPELIGEGPGRGLNLNLPLTAGAGDGEMIDAYHRALERLIEFSPELVLFEAGFDSHHLDPTSDLRVGAEGFHELGVMTSSALSALNAAAVFELGGGYAAAVLTDGLPAFISGLGAAS